MKSIALTLALTLGATTLLTSAQAAESPKRASKPSFQIDVPPYSLDSQVFYLRSGLTVMFQADHSHPIVSIMSIVDHGSGDDPKGAEGTAHFAEHTWFRSEQTVRVGYDENGAPIERKLPSIMDTLQDYGTLMNATTRNDWTDYRTVFSSEHLDLFLQLESRRLKTPYVGVTEDHINTERDVIRNEWRRRNEQGDAVLFDFLFDAVYPPGHPYASSSTKESLGNVNLKVLQKYFDDYYKPENTTIAVVGDFDIREASSLLFENFLPEQIDPKLEEKHIFAYPAPGVKNPVIGNPNHWWYGAYDPELYDEKLKPDDRALYSFLKPADANGPNDQAEIDKRVRISPNDPREEPPEPGTKKVVYKEAPIDYRTVAVAWSMPGGFREDHIALGMVGNIANLALYNYFNGDNFEIHNEEWKRSDIGERWCGAMTEKLNTTMLCKVVLKNDKLDPEQIAEKIIDQIPTIWNPDLVAQLEKYNFPRARNEQLANVLKSVDLVAYHFGGRAEDIVTYGHYTGQPGYHSAAMNQTMAMNALEIANMAEKYLTRKRAVTVIIDPLPKDKIEKTGEGSTWAGASDGDSVLESGDWLASITDKDIENAYIAPDLSRIKDETLPNGLRVIALPHGQTPVAYTSIVIGGGDYTGPKDAHKFAEYFSTSDAIEKNPGVFITGSDPLSIAGDYYWNFGNRDTVMALRHASGNVDEAMWMLREEIERQKPDTEGKSDYVKSKKKQITQAWGSKSPSWLIGEKVNEHIYGGDTRFYPTSFTEWENWDSWGATEIKATMAQRYQPKNATLIVTGAIDPEAAVESAKKYFGGWSPQAGATDDVESMSKIDVPPAKKEKKILIFDAPDDTQTQVGGYCRINYTDPSQKPIVSVLSSLLSNETFTRIRVKEALAYSPGGYATIGSKGVPYVGFSSLSVNDGAGRTVQVMKDIVATAEEGKFDENTIKMHKLREARNSGIEAQSTFQIGERLESIARNHETPESMLEVGAHIGAVSSKDVQAMIDGCSEGLMFTLKGPSDVIAPQLDKLGYTYEIVDWKSEGEARFAKFDPKGFKAYQKRKAKAAAKKAKAGGTDKAEKTDDAEG